MKQPFPIQRFGIIQLKQPFINGCLGFQVIILNILSKYIGIIFINHEIRIPSLNNQDASRKVGDPGFLFVAQVSLEGGEFCSGS